MRMLPLPHSAHEAAGALGTRHPPRPLIGEGGTSRAKLGPIRPRDREALSARQDDQPAGHRIHATHRFHPRALSSRSLSRTRRSFASPRRGRAGWGRHSGTADLSAASSAESPGEGGSVWRQHLRLSPTPTLPRKSGRGSAAEQASIDLYLEGQPCGAPTATVHGVVFDILRNASGRP